MKQLRARRRRIERELAAIDREIAKIRSWFVTEDNLRSALQQHPTPNARRINRVTVSDAIVELLRDRRGPLHYREIAETLVREKRYRTSSANFETTVAITILRDDRIVRVRPGVYGLRGRDKVKSGSRRRR